MILINKDTKHQNKAPKANKTPNIAPQALRLKHARPRRIPHARNRKPAYKCPTPPQLHSRGKRHTPTSPSANREFRESLPNNHHTPRVPILRPKRKRNRRTNLRLNPTPINNLHHPKIPPLSPRSRNPPLLTTNPRRPLRPIRTTPPQGIRAPPASPGSVSRHGRFTPRWCGNLLH